MLIRFGIFLGLMLSTALDLNGQMLSARRYTINDGLYETEVTGSMMTFDSLFYVWESNHTLSKFDGYGFEAIDSIEFTPYVINGAANLKNATFFWDSHMVYYDGKHFKNISTEWTTNDYYFQKNNVYILNKGHQIFRYDTSQQQWIFEKEMHPFFKKLTEAKGTTFRYKESLDGKFAQIIADQYYEYFNISGDSIYLVNPADYISAIDHNIYSLLDQKESTYFNSSSLFHIKYFYPESNPSSMIRIAKSKTGTSTLVDLLNNKVLGESPVSQSFVTNLSDQCIMMASHDGLFRLNPNIHFFESGKDNMITSLHTIIEDVNGKIWFGGYGSGFSIWDGNQMKKQVQMRDVNVMPGAYKHPNGNNYFFCDGKARGFYEIKNGKINNLGAALNNKPISGYFIRQLKNDKIAMGLSGQGLGFVENLNETDIKISYIDKEKGLDFKNVLAFTEDNGGRIWCMGGSKGIGVYTPERDTAYTYLKTSEQAKSFGGISLTSDEAGRIWFGSFRGVHVLEKPAAFDLENDNLFEKAKFIPLPDGEKSLVTFIDQVEGYIVFGNKNGISFLDLNSYTKDPEHPIIYQLIYGEDIQGGGSEQNTILLDSKRRLWIGSQDGATMIHWDDFKFDKSTNTIKIKSILAGTESLYFEDDKKIILPTDNRNCHITFGPEKNFSLLKNIFFDYYLINTTGDTIVAVEYDQNGVFERPYLEPGSYVLTINAKKHGQLMDSKQIKIYAPLSLSENPFFWVGLGAFILGIFGGFFFYQNRQRRINAEQALELAHLKNDRDNLQIQAIISSFNPHFINNSLHWAQSRYRKDDVMVKVIGRLSENIRYIFLNTRKGKAYHTLEDELRLVNNYVEIQRVRFKDSFEFRGPDLEELDHLKPLPIIILQLQIHIENAIEHGLRNRDQSSFVSLRISEEEKSYFFIIADDGIGRQKAEAMSSRGTQSGTKMLAELYSIFNSKNKNKINQYYEDLIFEDESGIKYGTRVTIEIPKNYKFDL